MVRWKLDGAGVTEPMKIEEETSSRYPECLSLLRGEVQLVVCRAEQPTAFLVLDVRPNLQASTEVSRER